MMSNLWPILELPWDASEKEIRRAYATRLRERRPDDDPARFQQLREEFEAALGRARLLSPSAAARDAPGRTALHPVTAPRTAAPETIALRAITSPQPVPPAAVDASAVTVRSNSREAVTQDICELLEAKQFIAACSRYDRARSTNEIEWRDEAEIELLLGQGFLVARGMTVEARADIAKRYGWNDAFSAFPLSRQIVAKYQAALPDAPKPGEKYIGQWNWGAFLLFPFWTLAHVSKRRAIYTLLYCLVPFAVLIIAFNAGRHGNVIAVRNRVFRDDAQFVAVQNAWRNWGFAVFACLFVYLLVENLQHLSR